MKCFSCDTDVREWERTCLACGRDVGFPNVRAAKAETEKKALATRYKAALTAAGMDSTTNVLLRFQEALRFSTAVICKDISKVKELVSSGDALYASFYELVGAGARRPEKSIIDRERLIGDDLLFPYYRDQIRFAALSLDGIGTTRYGSCSMVLKNLAINERATVFEGNSYEFCRSRELGFGKPVPPGYRAVWEERDLLGCAKLYSRLKASTAASAFPKILNSGKDFIEVHIYGPLHRRSLERIVLKRPAKREDEVLLKAIRGIVKKDNLPIIVEPNP